MPTVPTLTDGVVTLRAHRIEDAPRVLEQCQDPLSQAWTTVPVPYTAADAEHFVAQVVPGGWADGSEWAFAVEHDARFAGTVALRPGGTARAEIAYGAHPDVRGRGVMERALRLLLAWGFDERDLATVAWWANRGNWASRRLAWKLGFSFDGTVRQWLPQRGERYDGWVGTLLREEPLEPRSDWLTCPVIDTDDGLRLRPMVARDAPRIVEGCADPETQRWLGQLPAPYTLDDAVAYLESRTVMLAEGVGETWAVTEPGDDLLLGTVGWFNHTPGVECEIGYWTHPDARGRGVTKRALLAATDHVMATLGVRRVACHAAVGNAPSRGVIEAAGFRHYGVERRGAFVRDGRADLALYDVLAEEWLSARGGR